MVQMFSNNAKLIVITILCSYWFEANAKIDTSRTTCDQLQFWDGGNSNNNDARRTPKKRQKLPDKYPHVFQPLIENNGSSHKHSHQISGNNFIDCICHWTEENLRKLNETEDNLKNFLHATRLKKRKNISRKHRKKKKYRYKIKTKGNRKQGKLNKNSDDSRVTKKKNKFLGNDAKTKNLYDSYLRRNGFRRKAEDTNQSKAADKTNQEKSEKTYSKNGMVIDKNNNVGGENVSSIIIDKDYIRRSRLRGKTAATLLTTPKRSTMHVRQLDDSPKKEKEPLVDEFLSPYGIMPQMTRILQKFENANVTTEILGRTAEYNDIALFKITAVANETEQRFRAESKYMDEAPEKKIIFIVHGLTVMGLSMLSCLTEEDKVKILIGYYLSHLNNFDIFLIPIANPDGYVASRGGGFWNKNRSPQQDCSGVMLDRNFDVAWNQTHQLSSCSQAYPGPSPFSEAETRAVRDVFHYHGHKIIAYIHVHAGTYDTSAFKGDAILYPKGFTDIQSDDDKYIDMKGEVDEAMKNASFQVMSVNMDTLYSWYGKVSGTSVDYAATVYGIPYALEFVMQLYASNLFASEDEDLVEFSALTQIWKRMINVVFNYFAKSLQINTNESRKKGT